MTPEEIDMLSGDEVIRLGVDLLRSRYFDFEITDNNFRTMVYAMDRQGRYYDIYNGPGMRGGVIPGLDRRQRFVDLYRKVLRSVR